MNQVTKVFRQEACVGGIPREYWQLPSNLDVLLKAPPPGIIVQRAQRLPTLGLSPRLCLGIRALVIRLLAALNGPQEERLYGGAGHDTAVLEAAICLSCLRRCNIRRDGLLQVGIAQEPEPPLSNCHWFLRETSH